MTNGVEEAPAAVETPHGRLNRPLGTGAQGLVIFGTFAGGPALGWAVGPALGDLSETARTLLCVPFVAVFFLGYTAWIARLRVIAFRGVGLPLLRALFLLIVKRRKPRSLEEVLPREKLVEMAVKAQAAGGAFRRVAWLVGIASGLVAAFLDSATAAPLRFVLVAGTTVAWGYALAVLARRGWLPVPEHA